MENKDLETEYLPIGTIVLLKGGKKELMITSFCVFPTGKLYEEGKEVNSIGKVYDYGACTYPEGILNPEQIICFNKENIEKVCHMGYNTDEHAGFSKILSETISEVKREVKSGELKVEEGQA